MLFCTVFNDVIYFSDSRNHYYTREYLKEHGFQFHGPMAENFVNGEYVEMETILNNERLKRRNGAIIHCLNWQLGNYNAASNSALDDAEFVVS